LILPIKTYGQEVLRQPEVTVSEFDGELAGLARNMAETMYSAPGIGLAAPQVGQGKRLIVVDVSHQEFKDRLYTVVNPEVVAISAETDRLEEGCLSIPGVYEPVVRPSWARIKGQDLQGQDLVIEAEDLLARCFLHEIDHLEGILFVDRLVSFRSRLVRQRLKKLFGTLSLPATAPVR